jgi:chorismate-pyruvate lyase
MVAGRKLKPKEVPEPYRTLLVHSRDMTPTLAAFYGAPPELRVLSRHRDGEVYFREVLLTARDRVVEYGVIRILLEHFPSAARECVLGEQIPLGAILARDDIPHVGWPQAFFETQVDDHMRNVLRISGTGVLFGRRNVLLDGSRRLLAEVIEILAPTNGFSGELKSTT